MSGPGPARRLGWALARGFLSTVGRLSDGVRMCYEHGLTSGTMLAYVYRNRPSGRLGIGRWIDARFLGNPGWQAVRDRRALLEAGLEAAITALRDEGRAVSLVDVASGPGAYVQAVLSRVGEHDVTALCRDLDERGLAEGRESARRHGLAHLRYEHADAFDAGSLAAVRPRPNVIVASGFYDWIPDDADVRRSLAGIAAALEPGGWCVVTNQCAHPDLAFTQAVFPGHTAEALRMKMRPAETMAGWMRAAGLEPVETRLTAHGYYSITRARKAPDGEA